MQLEQREKCEGKGGQEPRVRLQYFNEEQNFSCQHAHQFLFLYVKLKVERTHQDGTADGSRRLSCIVAALSQNAKLGRST